MPPKRKRNEPASEATGNRPSPHRPSDTNLGQHDQDGAAPNRRRSGAGARNTRSRNAERRDSYNRGPVSPTVPAAAPRPASSSSQAAPQPIAVPTPTAPVPVNSQPTSPVASSHYNYEVLTQSRISAWQQGGREEVVQHGISSRSDEDVEEISKISQEFIQAVLESRVGPADAGACIKEILGPQPEGDDTHGTGFGFDAHGLFVDTISIAIDSENGSSKQQLRDFIIATQLSPKLLREVLDPSALEQLKLIRSTFTKMGIRHATNLLYRQSNYNLLREESEGFSKLIMELYFTPLGLNQEQLTKEQVAGGFERIKGLIGTFDLDVGRVLDIVFDVFASTMMRTFRYYTMFLRVSSWWPRSQITDYDPVFTGGLPRWAIPGAPFVPSPEELTEMDEKRLQRDVAFWDRARDVHLDAFFELGGRKTEDADMEHFANASPDVGTKTDAEIEWIKATKTLPPTGNRMAAQLLGFKLRYYTSEARDKDEIILANLFYMAAYLIKIGFLSLIDLYAHLWPFDDKMDTVRERRMQELEEKERKDRQGAEPNALLKAGALTDDTAPAASSRTRDSNTTKPEATQKDTDDAKEEGLPEPKEVLKVDLLHHLLLVGAIPDALFMLGRFPWLPDAYPDEIITPINRILLFSIDKVYQQTRPREVNPTTGLVLKPELSVDQSSASKGHVKLDERTPQKILKWPHADGYNKGMPYEHYLKEWNDNVPVCQTVDDIFTLCGTFLNISGVNIGRTSTLLKKLAAIGAKSLAEDQSQHNVNRWQDLLKRTMFPALNLTSSNVDVVDAVWSLLKHYPTNIRYNIYAECYEGQISRLPAMTKAFKYARLDTLAILKRLSLQNISSSAKHLAKVALFSPGVVCKVALDQIEAYTNLIEAFVECAKYFTDLGHDVLVWSLMSSLGGKQRSRTQESSVLLTSKWLQALSKFSGKVFRRYVNMDSTPVIQYVNNQLALGNSTDLVILRELITSMGGIVSDIDFTDAQLAALSGGEELRRQTFINLGDKRHESSKSASRLMKALVDTKLAPLLLTNMAQYRQCAIYQLSEDEAHIKYLATVIDDSQQAVHQYVELLRSNLSPEQFDAQMPSIPRLMTEFGLDTNLAFLIGRTSLGYYLTGPGAVTIKGRRLSNELGPVGQGDVSMEVKDTSGAVALNDTDAPGDQMVIDEQEPKETFVDGSSTPAINGRKADHFLDVLHPIVDAAKSILPSYIWDVISAEFYVLFWSLQTGDLSIPASSYNAESIRLQKQQDFIKKDRSDMTKAGSIKREQKKQEITQLATKLSTEATQCQERVKKTQMLLLKSASTWIQATAGKSNSVADIIIEECLMPRMLLSPGDADFCHKMVKFLHDHQVSNFKLPALYDRFFNVNRLRSMIFSVTVREAEFLGRFIKLALGELSKWHKSKEAYEKEATKGGKHFAFANAVDDDSKPTSVMDHDQFRDQLWLWHRNLAAALKTCLQGTEWMHIRNAITILKTVLDYFPAVDFHGKQFMTALQTIAEREAASKEESEDGQSHRVDLSVTANTAASALKKHASKWVIVQAFRPNTVRLTNRLSPTRLIHKQTGDSSDDRKAGEPIKNTQSSNLRPTAPDFKPTHTSSLSSRPKVAVEDEDGEVKDTKSQPSGVSTGAASKKDAESTKSAAPQKVTELSRSSSRPSTPTSRSSAPSPAPNSRREAQKPSPLSSLPPPPGLPSRPNVPFPSYFNQDERGQILVPGETDHGRDHRDPRESRDHRDPRAPRESRDSRDRPGDNSRSSRGRESVGSDRRTAETVPREAPRSERERHAPPRWEPPHDRESRSAPRDRPPSGPNSSRAPEPSRPTRDTQPDNKAMPPPAPPEPQGPPVNPERARLISATDEMINPARAALINDGRPPGRSSRDESRDRDRERDRGTRHSPPPPPRRSERAETRSNESGRDERSGRSHRSEHASSSRENRNEPPPSGPSRVEREGDRPRDSGPFQPPSQPATRGESDHGRLNHHQDPNYGRLNAIPSIGDMSNAPDGPRGRGRNMARGPQPPNPPPARPDGRFSSVDQSHRAGSPDRNHPPTGPASSRPRRGPAGPGHGNSSLNAPAATNSPNTTGIHPDRLRHLNAAPGPAPSPSQPAFQSPAASSVGVHPDRLNQIGSGAPPPSGPSHGRTLPPLQTPDRAPLAPGQSGLRQASGSLPITPATDRSGTMSAPTGPSAINDRSKSGGSRRQIAGINNVLRDAHMSGPDMMGRGGSLRSRSSRTSLANSDAQVLTGASPVSTPVVEKSEPFPGDRGEGGINGDDRSGHRSSRRHHEHSERQSRGHASRERSPGRESRSKEHRDYRERDSSGNGPNNIGREGERESSRRSGREPSGANRELMMSSAPGGSRESRHRGDGGRHVDYGRNSGGARGASGGGGSGGGRGDDRSREARGDEGGRGSRKRRSEEGSFSGPPTDTHKRQRR